MNRNLYKTASLLLVLVLLTAALAGCGQSRAETQRESGGASSAPAIVPVEPGSSSSSAPESSAAESVPPDNGSSETEAASSSADEQQPQAELSAGAGLTVRFGDGGAPFALHLYDNPTAAAIARHVGTADWRLPIYHYDDYENWEVMQYYDIPSRYEIPSDPESVESEAAGTVYYSDPNRIVLFYQDAQVTGEYTPVGYFNYTEEFVQAVEENPVLEGWGNKIVNISAGE